MDKLSARALSGWIRQDSDELTAVESWLKFKNKYEHKTSSCPWLRVLSFSAAACAVILLSTIAIHYKDKVSELTADTSTQIIMPPGQRSQVTLDDGTVVWLNANTVFSYPSRLSSMDERCVELDGEAYFEVSHDPKHPFVIKTPKTSVTVLGTKFDVRDFSSSDFCYVSLLEGKVDVSFNAYENSVISLSENDMVSLDHGTIHKGKYSDINFLLWTKGIYVFEDNSLKAIAKDLELYYGMEIRIVDDTLAEHTFSGKFRLNDGIETLLRTLQRVVPFKYKRAEGEDMVIIYN